MRAFFLRSAVLLAAPLCLANAADDLDAVKAAPDSHRVLLENDKIRVLRVTVAPGATEPVHVHGWPSIMYFEQPQPITYIVYDLVDGKLVERKRIDAPALPVTDTEWSPPEGPHAIMNRGTEPFLAVRVEFKDGGGGTP
jgi:predicted metal-dependent enzyme (double-stranded beta helix superfamily)